MRVGIYEFSSTGYPNLPLMKISQYHKMLGDDVSVADCITPFDRVYVSNVFGEEYVGRDDLIFNCPDVVRGGTGYAISVKNVREEFDKSLDKDLPYEIEHCCPDYDMIEKLYGITDTAFGFLTRGCPNACGFCIVSKKEGRVSHKVADLSEWWTGQRNIELFDPNTLAFREHIGLLQQLKDSNAKVNFMQGLDARCINETNVSVLRDIKTKMVHFAFDQMKNEDKITRGLQLYRDECGIKYGQSIVYMLTNYDTTMEENLHRIKVISDLGYRPDVRIYRK